MIVFVQNEYGPPPPHLIESVDHAMRLLAMFEEHSELRVTTVATELGVARSTAHRLLSTLAWRGFVDQDRMTKVYRPGRALVEIGLRSVSEFNLRRTALPHLETLSELLHETVNLLVLEEDSCRFVGGFEGDQAVRTRVLTGTLLRAYATSGGKMLLSELTQEDLRKLYPHGLRRITDRTKSTLDELQEELALIRSRGYAVNLEESAIGLRAVAVPVRDRIGRMIAALALSAPSSRLGKSRIAETVTTLRDFASRIRSELR